MRWAKAIGKEWPSRESETFFEMRGKEVGKGMDAHKRKQAEVD